MVCPLPPDELRDPQGGGGKVLLGLCKLQNLTIRYIHTHTVLDKTGDGFEQELTCARYFYNDNLFGVREPSGLPLCPPLLISGAQ